LLTLTFIFCFIPSLSHAGKPYLKHAIGDTITADEAQQYDLFQEELGFKIAEIIDAGYTHSKLLVIDFADENDKQREPLLVDNSVFKVLPVVLERADSLQAGLEVTEGIPATVTPKSGALVHGLITKWTGLNFILKTQFGVSTIPIDQIIDVDIHDRLIAVDQLKQEDPNRTRLFFMPTGRSLQRGEGYFAVYEVVLPGFQVGLGHNISIGGGFFPWSLPHATVGWFTGQVGIIDKDNYSLAVGNLTTFISGDGGASAGIFYGVGRVGSSKASATLGLGYGFVSASGESETTDEPFVVVGGELQTGRSTKIVTENWMLPGVDWPVVSLGMRWYGRRISVDFAVIRPMTEDFETLGIPWVDFVVHF